MGCERRSYTWTCNARDIVGIRIVGIRNDKSPSIFKSLCCSRIQHLDGDLYPHDCLRGTTIHRSTFLGTRKVREKLNPVPNLCWGKAIGWHSFRHSLATNQRAARVGLKTAQQLLRHANSRIKLDVYTRAISAKKREANNRVMEMVFEAGKKAFSAPSSAPARGAQPQKKKGADRSGTWVSTLRSAS